MLEQIGQALDDWEVGPDAMRCAPARPGLPETPRRPLDRWSFLPAVADPAAPTLDEFAGGQDLSPYITQLDTWASDLAALMDIEILPWQRHVLDHWVTPQPGDRVVLGFDGSSHNDLTLVVGRASSVRGYNVTLHLIDEARWDAAIEGHQPLPLPIDGHEYARRRRNRRRS